MRIVGEWHLRGDGVAVPAVTARVATAYGQDLVERFLVDTGADRTVLRAPLLASLGLPVQPPPPGFALAGVGGSQGFVIVNTTLELVADDNTPARIQGGLSVFTDPAAADMSILGRDVLDHFDLIACRIPLLTPAVPRIIRLSPHPASQAAARSPRGPSAVPWPGPFLLGTGFPVRRWPARASGQRPRTSQDGDRRELRVNVSEAGCRDCLCAGDPHVCSGEVGSGTPLPPSP